MRQENFERVFQQLQALKPYQPLTLELVSGGRIEVNHPEALKIYPNGLLSCLSSTNTRSIFEVGSVVRILTATGTT
jgi:hypothetical protein